jgi:hypothetical protein
MSWRDVLKGIVSTANTFTVAVFQTVQIASQSAIGPYRYLKLR